jgi:hypothetical protein
VSSFFNTDDTKEEYNASVWHKADNTTALSHARFRDQVNSVSIVHVARSATYHLEQHVCISYNGYNDRQYRKCGILNDPVADHTNSQQG